MVLLIFDQSWTKIGQKLDTDWRKTGLELDSHSENALKMTSEPSKICIVVFIYFGTRGWASMLMYPDRYNNYNYCHCVVNSDGDSLETPYQRTLYHP